MYKKIINYLLDLFLDKNCPLCGRSTSRIFCIDCERSLSAEKLKYHHISGRHLPLLSWGIYGGIIKRSIAMMKYNKHPEIAAQFGEYLGEAWLKKPLISIPQKLTLVPIPLHEEKLKTRGFNQAQIIAKNFGKITNITVDESLKRDRQTKPQFQLSPQERKDNLTNAFIIHKHTKLNSHTPVILVDDIYTTGTTINEAIKTFQQGGIPVVGVVVVATSQPSVNKI